LSTYEKHVFRSATGPLPYRLWRPSTNAATPAAPPESAQTPERKFPLLLFLHGAGERGCDNEVTLVHGAKNFSHPELQSQVPSFVVIPQCPAHDVWASIERTHEPTQLSPQPSPALQAVQALLQSLLTQLPIDPQRIYLTGLSMGGYGAWDLLMRDPDFFAAAILICGGADVRFTGLAPLANKPLWVFHGDQDDVVPVARSREIVERLRELGGTPRYTEYLGGDHDSWTATYGNATVLQWLFGQVKL
jgi:predicted peptidase